MFNFFKRKAAVKPAEPAPASVPATPPDPLQALAEQIGAAAADDFNFNLRSSEFWPQVQAMDGAERVMLLRRLIAWQAQSRLPTRLPTSIGVRGALIELGRGRLPWDEAGLLELVAWSSAQVNSYLRCLPQVHKALEGFVETGPLTPRLATALEQLVQQAEKDVDEKDGRAARLRLQEQLGAGAAQEPPLNPGELWADAALAEIAAMLAAKRQAWAKLLKTCQAASGSAPSAKWRKGAQEQVQALGDAQLWERLARWFVLVEQGRSVPAARRNPYLPDPNLMLDDQNADVLKGLAWLCAGQDDPALARALTALALTSYKKVPGVGPRCPRLGSACIYALGEMTGMEGVAQLVILKVRVKFTPAQKGIAEAFEKAATRLQLPPEEIEELSVPSYGLEEVGLRREELAGFSAELRVDGSDASLRWLRPDGKPQASVPAAVRKEHAEELKELQSSVKDIERMLTAQRARLDGLFLEQRRWPFEAWKERYLDHPLVGTIARRLIWKFSRGDQASSGTWDGQRLAGRDERPLNWLDSQTWVELWHPLSVAPEVVLEWRARLEALGITQPFKQAHREVYLLTDAERTTRTYSNRFAAHVVRQHQFNALCAERGWKNQLRLMVDADYPPPSRLLPSWGLRAEFWVEGAGSEYGVDTNETGTYLYLATDQVRFYPLEAPQSTAYAAGGGYNFGQGPASEPLLLEQVPPLVFSEILRDVDLFVGVASVGNDPTWSDGGPQGRYADYWNSYSFGELSESAQTRHQVLEGLLPRLKIAKRCTLEARFLVVRGDLRTYKIHLGSGNIQMEPGSQYLCIVPGQSPQGTAQPLFLPFEGDRLLAIILSKAFLLAEDAQITAPTITSQIRRR